MNFDDLLREQIEQLDLQNPENGPLIKQVLEYWASIKDTGINNQLLQELVENTDALLERIKEISV